MITFSNHAFLHGNEIHYIPSFLHLSPYFECIEPFPFRYFHFSEPFLHIKSRVTKLVKSKPQTVNSPPNLIKRSFFSLFSKFCCFSRNSCDAITTSSFSWNIFSSSSPRFSSISCNCSWIFCWFFDSIWIACRLLSICFPARGQRGDEEVHRDGIGLISTTRWYFSFNCTGLNLFLLLLSFGESSSNGFNGWTLYRLLWLIFFPIGSTTEFEDGIEWLGFVSWCH